MAVEWLVLWGAGKAVGALAKPVLEDLAKDIAKDQGKSFFGKAMKRAAKLIPHDEFLKLYGKAIKELVEVIDEELQNAAIAADNIDVWAKDLKQFVRTETIREALPNAFSSSTGIVEGYELKRGWPAEVPLPPDFDWDFVAKAFNRKLKKLREDDADFRAVLQAQAAVETAENTKQILGVQPDFNLEKYRESLLESHQHLKLELLDPNGSSYKVQLRSVFVPQTVRDCQEYVPQVFEIPKEHLARLRKEGGLDESLLNPSEEMIETRRRSYLEQSPRSVLEVIADNRHSHLVILGSPGSGKSTLLKALALEWAQLPTAKERTAQPLPLFIELNHYHRSGEKGFLRYLHNGRIACQMNQAQLDEVLKRRGGAVLLLDGLDEIFELQGREDTVNDIQRFSNDYPDTPVIVTSRIIGYQQKQLSEAGFRHFMLQDLDDEQIEDFLNRWHQTFVPEAQERNTKRRRLAEAISSSRAIRELADNPLLLTMMSILNLHQELPRDRVQLYEQASRVLLHQWDTERALDSHPQLKGHVGPKEKAEMLREIAYAMQSAPEGLAGNLISEGELEAMFCRYLKEELGFTQPRAAARDLIEQLRLRNFILCYRGGGSYSFVHRTFLEYFCACGLALQSVKEESSLDFLKIKVFGPHWQDETWHEVLRLIAGMDGQVPVERVAAIVDFLLTEKDDGYKFHNIFLAAQCCLEIRNPRRLGATRTRVTDVLLKLVRFELTDFSDQNMFIENLLQLVEIRTRVVGFLANPQLFDPAHSWIKDNAKLDNAKLDNWIMRLASVNGLAHAWSDDPDTFPFLKDCAVNDSHWEVRQEAVEQLARRWKNDPETLPLLKTLGAKDKDWIVRLKAVEELAHGWRGDPEVWLWLKDRAVNDPWPTVEERPSNIGVRGVALEAIAQGWPDDPRTRLLLLEQAEKETLPWLREKAKQMADKLAARGMTPPPPSVKP